MAIVGLLMGLSIITLIISLVGTLILVVVHNPTWKKWGAISVASFGMILFCASLSAKIGGENKVSTSVNEPVIEIASTTANKTEALIVETDEQLWQIQFSEAGFTDDEITNCEDVLRKLGLTEIHIMDFNNNGRMNILRARIFNSADMQLNVTFEDHILIYVELTGIMENNEVWSNRTDKLTLGIGLQGRGNILMYSDTEGGALAMLNWNDKELSKAEQASKDSVPTEPVYIEEATGYQAILDAYTEKLEVAAPVSSVKEMAEIANEGVLKMAEYMWEAKGTDGQMATYTEWADKLYDVYLSEVR
ncbi:hypothetical protein FACS189499_03890 [Clostridia bacterium]|nr:hypothetical protein FACS189499_03890 [Clostridia bacterium]